MAAWLGLALFCFYLLSAPRHEPYGDEGEYLAVAENLLTSGSPLVVTHRQEVDGGDVLVALPSERPLGQSLLLLPFAGAKQAAQRLFPDAPPFVAGLTVAALPALAGAGICALLYLLLRTRGAGGPRGPLAPGIALAIAATAGVATQLWPSSRTLFADQSVALLLTFSIYALVRYRRAGGETRWLTAAAWAASLMALCKYQFILACPALFLYGARAVAERTRMDPAAPGQRIRRLFLAALAPFAVVAVVQLWYNHYRYDSLLNLGYVTARGEHHGFDAPLLVGLYGLLLSTGRSLFLYSPPCILGILGARRFARSSPAEAALAAGILLPLLLVHAKWRAWSGGWGWGNRFLLFAVPLCLWAAAPAIARWWNARARPRRSRLARRSALLLLLAASVAIQGVGVLIDPVSYVLLAQNEVRVLEYPTYQQGVWEIADESPHMHFVPQFSPVAAHAWLAWATWNRTSLPEGELARAAPWHSLNPKWAPGRVLPYLGYDLWFWGPSAAEAPSRGAALLAAGILVSLLAFATARCLAALGQHSPER